MISLSAFARLYGATRRICRTYAATLVRRAVALESHAGETAIDRVLTAPPVNAFLASLDRSPYTIRSYRSDYLSLWNAAADQDLLPYPVMRRIYRPPAPELAVECYTIEEARQLLAAAKTLAGKYPNGVAKSRYWSGAVRVAWDAGIRRGDVWNFRRGAVRPDGTARIVQGKTGSIATVRLRPATVAALDEIGGEQPLRWSLDPSFFGRHFKKMVIASGVGRGTFKYLRRASGSYVELAQPGTGHKHLGHKHRSTFDRFYDAKLGAHLLPMPPEL